MESFESVMVKLDQNSNSTAPNVSLFVGRFKRRVLMMRSAKVNRP